MRALGRIKPKTWDHLVDKPLDASRLSIPKPVAIGCDWYDTFDEPKQLHDGSWHLPDASRENLGTVRGGHCFCLVQMGGVKHLNTSLQIFYDQGQEGACEGFGHAKAQTLERGMTFDPWFLYDQARMIDGTYPEGEGTSNHSVARVLEAQGAPEQVGPKVATRGAKDGPTIKVKTIRWTISTTEVLLALGRPNAQSVPFSNSWGVDYPLVTWMPVATLTRLLHEEGEADCETDYA